MSLSGLPPAPSERCAIRQDSDGWTITLEASDVLSRAVATIVAWAAGIGLLILIAMMAHMSRGGDRSPYDFSGLLVIVGVALAWALYRTYHDFIFATFHASDGRLVVVVNRWGRKRQLGWEPGDIKAVGAWDGLHIVARSRSASISPRWDSNDLWWVAEVLRTILNVPEQLPAGQDEINVHYVGSFWDRPVAGVLGVGVGKLTLRHPLVRESHLVFRPTDGPRSPTSEPVIRLTSSDIACRILEGEPSQLSIRPDGVKVEARGGVYRIRVPVFGPFIHYTFRLPRGCVLKQQLASSECEFHMTFWCEDAEGLQRALARFWGNEEPSGEPGA